ncbi:MAG TPA: tetratricopeptide repeat protein [Pyrinomonadaceae bacterium]|nr:tetratricopeptide repeat protein [Pyrinomonadaceae bacterium]
MKRQPLLTTRALLLTALFLLACAPALRAQPKGEMKLTASKEALALFEQGRTKTENLEDPGTLFEQAIQKDPNFAIAYLFAGRTNQDFWNNLSKAVGLADKVSPGEREWILATKAQAEGDLPGMKAHLDQLLKLHPEDVRAQVFMAGYYANIGDDATSLKHFNNAVMLDKNYAPAYNNIGYANFRLGRYEAAEKAFQTYIKLIPNNPNPYDSYAELLMKMGRYDDSIKQYNMALSKDASFVNSYRGVGDNYAYKGDYAKAREAFRRMYDKAPDDNWRDTALASLSNSYVLEGKTDEALKAHGRRLALAEARKDSQALIGLHANAAFLLAEAGRFDDAAKELDAADKLREDESLPAAFRENTRFGRAQTRAFLLIRQQQFDPAGAQLAEAWKLVEAKKNPNWERGYNESLGYLELGRKNYAKAIEYFSKGNPNDPFVWFHAAEAYEASGDRKKAAELYQKIVSWNSLDDTGYAVVRPRAAAKLAELSKGQK